MPSRIAFATSLASARVGSGECTIVSSIWVAVITGFPRSSAFWMIRFWTSGTSAGPISTPRSPRATITASVSARTSSRTSTASDFSIFAITCACEPACSSSARRSRTSAGERMKESATKSTPVSMRPLEVGQVLPRQRRDRHRDAREVDALVRADETAHHDGARRAAALDLVDAEPHAPVVDQHVVAGLEHVPDHRRRDRQLAVGGVLLCADLDAVARAEHDRLLELADAQLRPLQVGDQRDRAADLGCDLAHEPGPRGMLVVRSVREVEPDGVDARLDQRAQALARVRRRAERRHDLGPPFDRHPSQGTNGCCAGTPPSRGTPPCHQAPPRSGAAGCTSRRGRCAQGRPS